MTTTDTAVQNLIINKLTKEQYESIQNPNATELYLVPDTGEEFVPSQTDNSGKFLTTDGTNMSWQYTTIYRTWIN